MTPSEAIKAVKDSNLSSEAAEYAISAIEKDIPKIPIDNKGEYGFCSNCNTIIGNPYASHRCDHCGQRIDWR